MIARLFVPLLLLLPGAALAQPAERITLYCGGGVTGGGGGVAADADGRLLRLRRARAGAPLDHVNNLGWTALIESIVLGNGGPRHQATLQALIHAGASVRLADRHGQTPLQLARARGYAEMVRMLERAAP